MGRHLVLFFALLAPSLSCQESRDDLSILDIEYVTKVLEDRKTLGVELLVSGLKKPYTHVAMPNWTPGSYSLREFGKRVRALKAFDKTGGRELTVTPMDHQTWSIETNGVQDLRVSYEILHPNPRFGGRPTDDSTGMHFQAPTIYMYLVGAKGAPVRARYVLPEGWKVANGLLLTQDPWVRRARDYDTFIDAPTILGHFKEEDFDVAGTSFKCVFYSRTQTYDFDVATFVDTCKKIVTEQGRLFGSFPFSHYVFLFSFNGGGGLEHLNSTSIGLSLGGLRRNPKSGGSIVSHEFFHAWNVKRIRPKSLGPFEYEHENYTGNLWVSEGWTSYYGDLTLVRAGLLTEAAYIDSLGRTIQRELGKESRKVHSVMWASRNVWHRRSGEPPRVDYYAKGEILATCIDLQIRQATENRKSLDDVMRFMNRWFGERGQGLEEDDVERACTAVSNHDFREFFARHVSGTLDPPLATCLGFAGITYDAKEQRCDLPYTYRRTEEGLRIFNVRQDAEVPEDGPKRGDLIVAVDDSKDLDLAPLFRELPGREVTLSYIKGGDTETRSLKVKLVPQSRLSVSLRMQEAPTDLQRAIQKGWLAGRP